MSIHEIYQAKTFEEAIETAQHNCATCTKCGCKDVQCPSQKALMNVTENRYANAMSDYERKSYFRQIGG